MNEYISRLVTRRVSLMTLGVAGLHVVGMPIVAGAKQSHKKNRPQKHKRAGQDPNALCKRQAEQCTAFFTAGCKGDLACLAKAARCCPGFTNCQFDSAFLCLVAP